MHSFILYIAFEMKEFKSNLQIKEKLDILITKWSFKQLVALFFATCLLATFNFLPIKWVHFHTAVGYTKDTIIMDYNRYYKGQKSNNKTIHVILFWTTFFGQEGFGFGMGHQPFIDHNCSVSNCITSSNRSLINESDAVIFHVRGIELNDLPNPKFRKPHQFYIFYLYESPVHTYLDLKLMKGYFNWTMTYRLDSDIVVPNIYYKLDNITDAQVTVGQPTYNMTTTIRPRKFILWAVSNCETHGGREHYIEELRKYVQVDEYGECSHRICTEKFVNAMYREYKFYLAFENSLCKDYVTEKYYKILFHNLVPVCYGLGNYSAVGPLNAFIDARNFESPQSLAEYLMKLDFNDTAYNQYLAWKSKYKIRHDLYTFCELCKRLNEHNPTKIYNNIYNWWYNGAENSEKQICISKLPYNPI